MIEVVRCGHDPYEHVRTHLGWLFGGWLVAVGCSQAPSSANPNGAGGQNQGGGAPVAGSAGAAGTSVGGNVAAMAGSPSGGVSAGAASGGGGNGGAGTADVDATTLVGKHLFGYQGWFSCPGDGGANRWVHWFKGNTANATSATFDLWPDVSELDDDELFDTDLTMSAGPKARLFSAYNPKTVARHFAWMQTAGIDGVFVQRFLSDVKDASTRKVRDQVLNNVRAGAEQHGRIFSVMYDISSAPEATLVGDLEADWAHLTGDLHVTDSARYIRHGGKPVLAIWGLGFNDRPGTPTQAQQLQDDLRGGPVPVTLLGGVPKAWRTLSEESKTDAAWAAVYRHFDVVSPWSVGAYTNDAQADDFKKQHIVPDLAELTPLHIDYMPVVFPGFSWHNLKGAALNQIPRHGGSFYWRQVFNAVQAGSTMLYGAMFDEVDEGTAFFKVAPSQSSVPAQGSFVAWDADGATLPSDWYLQLAGAATKTLRGELTPSETLPLTPPP